jgi:hypothetical protein
METIRIHRIRDGHAREDIISEISESELSQYTVLGTAAGTDVNHCAYLGLRHCPDFLGRVAGFRIDRDGPGTELGRALKEAEPDRNFIAVTFYERKG